MRPISRRLARALLSVAIVGGVLSLPSAAPALTACGAITTDTTWTIADSPVSVTCTVVVYPGVTLRVDPGVTVQTTPGAGITIRGRLTSAGTSGSHVVFTSASAPTFWNGIAVENLNGGSAGLDFTDIRYAQTGASVQCCGGPSTPLRIWDSVIANGFTGLSGYAGSARVEVRRTTITGNTRGVDTADKDIFDSTFSGNGCGLCQTERVNVYGSQFTGNTTAIDGGRGQVKNSTFTGNGTALKAFYEGMTASKNTITGNGTGILLPFGTSIASPITYNNIHSNTVHNVRAQGTANQDLSYNWWGTTNAATIDAGIYDAYDQGGLGIVGYLPLLTQAVTQDTTPPDTLITAAPASLTNSQSATFVFTATETPATFECSLDAAAFTACTSPRTYAGLADGGHTFRVRATDNDANLDPSPASHTWTIDTVPPDTSITAGPSGPANPPSGAFSFTASEPGSGFECALDDASFAPCTSPRALTDLADGGHVFRVRAVDAAGNTDPSPATRFWSVDGTPPEVSILSPAAPGVYAAGMRVPAGTDTPVVAGTVVIEVRATDAGSGVTSFVLEIDGTPVPSGDVTRDGSVYRYAWSGYGPGPHTISAIAVDAAGLGGNDVREVLGLFG